LRCWECDDYVPAGQRLRSVGPHQAIVCATCEPLVASVHQSAEETAS
jgi:hypothetical protein